MVTWKKAWSTLTGWARSCLTCPAPGEGSRQPVKSQNGVQNMAVCHTQPDLVRPTKPDDMSGQGFIPQNHNSISSRPQEHQDSATRAPRWRSKSRKKSSRIPLRVGAPSNFRVLESARYADIHNFVNTKSPSTSRSTSSSSSPLPSPSPSSLPSPLPSIHYEPLDLRIHQSDNRLSDLPSFKSFQLNETTQYNAGLAAPRALNYSASIQKPVGSEKLNSQELEERDQITSRLIPHFSTRVPVDLKQTAAVKSPLYSRSNSWRQRLTLSGLFSSKTRNSQSCERVPQRLSASRSLHTTSANSSPPPIFKRTSSSTSSQTMPSQTSLLPQASVSLPDNRISDPSTPLSPSRRVTQWIFPSQDSPTHIHRPKDAFKWESRHSLSAASAPCAETMTGARPRNTVCTVSPSGNPPCASSPFFLSPTIEENLGSTVHRQTISIPQPQKPPVGGYQAYETTRRTRSSVLGVGIAF